MATAMPAAPTLASQAPLVAASTVGMAVHVLTPWPTSGASAASLKTTPSRVHSPCRCKTRHPRLRLHPPQPLPLLLPLPQLLLLLLLLRPHQHRRRSRPRWPRPPRQRLQLRLLQQPRRPGPLWRMEKVPRLQRPLRLVLPRLH